MMYIFVTEISERWRYTLDFIFGLRGIDFQMTDSFEEFEQFPSTKISFVNWEKGSILNERTLTKQSVSKSDWKGTPCLAFDGISNPLSSIFYVLTRMEEYHLSQTDRHNRFEGKKSIQFESGWLEQSICDRWAKAILEQIELELGLKFPKEKSAGQMIPTFDIDNTYAFLWKSGKRKILSIAKDWVNLNFNRLKERKAVLAGKLKDPYDTFEKIESIAKQFPVRLFWLIGNYGSFDKNISIENRKHKELVQQLCSTIEIGIHPSYTSNSIPQLVKTEKEKLEQAMSKSVGISRQHFLKLKFPLTYQNLISQGIREDFTMGFADAVGLRNGTARVFPWFDLSTNERTELLIRPFVYMDGTLNEYMNLSPAQAKEKIKQLFDEVQQFGGDFVFIWHNETIGEYGIWEGWRSVLDYTLSLKAT